MEETVLNQEANETTAPNAENTPQNEAETAQNPLSELEQAQAEIAEQKDKYLRLMAEFENFKRRTGKDVIVSLLEVLDDCDRAEKQLASTDDIAVQKEGIQLVFNKVRSIMQSKGLKAMESINTPFDVELHEAITEVPVPDDMKGKVVDEVTKGYLLNDKIIRFAKVVVGK
jgi:molecular chaperone GrpE